MPVISMLDFVVQLWLLLLKRQYSETNCNWTVAFPREKYFDRGVLEAIITIKTVHYMCTSMNA